MGNGEVPPNSGWIIGFTRGIFRTFFQIIGLESFRMLHLVELVRSVTIVPSADRWNWNLESTGIFSVASARRRIDEICLPNIGEETRWVLTFRNMFVSIFDNAIESTDICSLGEDWFGTLLIKVLSWWNLVSKLELICKSGSSLVVSIRMDSKLKKMFESCSSNAYCVLQVLKLLKAVSGGETCGWFD
ncbi:hypothetical protein Tco_0658914 [Tanacetum coccineum]